MSFLGGGGVVRLLLTPTPTPSTVPVLVQGDGVTVLTKGDGTTALVVGRA